MSFDLTNGAGEWIGFSNSGWTYLLPFAEAYGWQPAGSLPSDDADLLKVWDGGYDTQCGQRVTDADAAALAGAIERGMEAANRAEVSAGVAREMTRMLAEAGFADEQVSPVTFEEKGVKHWIEFVAFCRRGGFRIE